MPTNIVELVVRCILPISCTAGLRVSSYSWHTVKNGLVEYITCLLTKEGIWTRRSPIESSTVEAIIDLLRETSIRALTNGSAECEIERGDGHSVLLDKGTVRENGVFWIIDFQNSSCSSSLLPAVLVNYFKEKQ